LTPELIAQRPRLFDWALALLRPTLQREFVMPRVGQLEGAIVIGVLVVLNLVTFVIFGWDKFCATHGRRRVSERALLTLMAVGGSPGGWAGMLVFHHKTRKTSFRWAAIVIVLLQAAALVLISLWLAGG
jgi:uncharacterized membrane protein YsdA (DUF1294 family)